MKVTVKQVKDAAREILRVVENSENSYRDRNKVYDLLMSFERIYGNYFRDALTRLGYTGSRECTDCLYAQFVRTSIENLTFGPKQIFSHVPVHDRVSPSKVCLSEYFYTFIRYTPEE